MPWDINGNWHDEWPVRGQVERLGRVFRTVQLPSVQVRTFQELGVGSAGTPAEFMFEGLAFPTEVVGLIDVPLQYITTQEATDAELVIHAGDVADSAGMTLAEFMAIIDRVPGVHAVVRDGVVGMQSDAIGADAFITINSFNTFTGADGIAPTPLLINRVPEPDEVEVPLEGGFFQDPGLGFQVFDAVGPAPGETDVQIFVNEQLVWDAGEMLYGFVDVDQVDARTLYMRWVPPWETPWTSAERIDVRVVYRGAELGSWSFVMEDLTPPELTDVEARGVSELLVRFNEPMADLTPDAFALERVSTFAVLSPVTSVERVSENAFRLRFSVPLTFGATYRLVAVGAVDARGNPIDEARSVVFQAYNPEVPEGRRFQLWDFIPEQNRRADRTRDLYRFIMVTQEVTNVLLYEIDRMSMIIDPDLAPEVFVDAMLADLGNPFTAELSLADKRRLIAALTRIYQLKGTSEGIIALARFLLGLELEIVPHNEGGWVLGESELGESTIMGPDRRWQVFAFDVLVDRPLTADERARIYELIEFMRPAHTHLGRILEPGRPDEAIDHVSLGFSKLGEEFILH